MNIFVLDPDPAIAASYHCDQHLHKMILESAQMLCTWAHVKEIGDPILRRSIYKPAYINHPCTQWIIQDIKNVNWVIQLCLNIQEIRYSLGCNEHSSMLIIRAIRDFVDESQHENPTSFIFTGNPALQLTNLTVPEKYQYYYRNKHLQWIAEKNQGMTYKNRPIPPFMSNLIQS